MFKNDFSIILVIEIKVFFLFIRFIETFFFLSFISVLIKLTIFFINILNRFVEDFSVKYVLNETFLVLITFSDSFNIWTFIKRKLISLNSLKLKVHEMYTVS